MVFSREVPRAVEVMTAAAASASSSSPSHPPHRPVLLRGKPRSHIPIPALRAWANQRRARCVDGAGDNASPVVPAPPPTSSPPSPPSGRRSPEPRDDGFERIRAKLMDHLREASDRIELPVSAAATASVASGEEETDHKGDPAAEAPVEGAAADGYESHAATPATPVSVAAAPTLAAEELPWNLRTRRSAPAYHGRHQPNSDPVTSPPAKAAFRLRSGGPERREATLRRRRPRFSVPLTKEEIDEDVYAFTGRLAARRPKRRPRAVQRQLDMLLPGMYLSEVTVDMYQVADPPPPPPS